MDRGECEPYYCHSWRGEKKSDELVFVSSLLTLSFFSVSNLFRLNLTNLLRAQIRARNYLRELPKLNWATFFKLDWTSLSITSRKINTPWTSMVQLMTIVSVRHFFLRPPTETGLFYFFRCWYLLLTSHICSLVSLRFGLKLSSSTLRQLVLIIDFWRQIVTKVHLQSPFQVQRGEYFKVITERMAETFGRGWRCVFERRRGMSSL